ncbi:MAG: phosphodiester glycosidase family protein, partial [Clostridia bacterium]|nr:phosphodiester glycosidase family protein [Clostridia bacterium]
GIGANAAVLHVVLEKKELMGGVSYQYIRRLESYGWQNIHVVTADLKAPGVELAVLKSQKGESFLESTYDMAVSSDALAAINADFFAAKQGQNGRGSAVGVEIRDGELKSSASVAESMNTLYKPFGSDGFLIDAFIFDITVTAANGKTDKIKLVNKYDDLTGIVMYTDDWGETAVGSIGGIVEVSIDKHGKVVEKAMEAEPLAIPEGGYVLASHLSYNTFLLDHVNVGDKISVDITSKPNLKKIETAVGGGGVILKNGVVPSEFSHNISGRNPRSAVGIDKTGTVITMVVVDGRSKASVGMTQIELGHLMQDLGCDTALNFDGGGSTLMAIDNNGEKEVVNKPSDGTYRKVTNSLGVISTAESKSPAVSAKLLAPEQMFLNTGAKLEFVGLDKYKREVSLGTSKVTYTAQGGTVKNGVFYPAKTGTFSISAKSGKLTAKTTITVLDTPREMNFEGEKITLNAGETFAPVLIGKDANGKKAQIRLSDVTVTTSGNAVRVEKENIVATKTGAAVITAKFGDTTANMAVMVGGAKEISVPKNQVIQDTQNTYRELTKEGAFRFTVFGNTREETVLFDQFLMNTALYKMKGVGDFQVFLGANVHEGKIGSVLNDYVTAKHYNRFDKGESTFITLPNVSSAIYNGDATVWTKFAEDVGNAKQNLFIFLDRNFISNDEAELQAFYRIVNTAAAGGKHVYVFGGGFVNQNTIDDGVRYINTAGIFPSISIGGTSPSYIQYVVVTVNGADVTYEYKPIIGD